MYSLEFKDSAKADLLALPEKIQRQIASKLRVLSESGPNGSLPIKALTGKLRGTYRIRSGNYRIIFKPFKIPEPKIIVIAIGDRKEIYG